MRTKLIAGNWKMHMGVAEALALVKALNYGVSATMRKDIVVAPPFTALHAVANCLQNSFIAVAAQNIYWQEEGAFTGEISAKMAKDVGADYAIIGHSERRAIYGESDEEINLKIKVALEHELIPIFCIGETLEQRKAGLVNEILSTQITEGLKDLSSDAIAKVVLAYEPVWAIGTGVTATLEQVEETHAMLREKISQTIGQNVADCVKILYGGSVKPDNAKEILALPNVDGVLVGGASLTAEDFIKIIG